MKRVILFVCCAIAFLALSSCTTYELVVPAGVSETEPAVIDDNDDNDGSALLPYTPPYTPPTEFDFSEFSGEDFPRGTWTVNQLIGKYGEPESLYGWPGALDAGVGVEFDHKDVKVLLASWEAELFSSYETILEMWYDASLEDRTFELSGQDKNIELTISALWFYENSVEFPRNIRIGESTKQDVLDAYHEEPADARTWNDDQGEVGYYDMVTYEYLSEEDGGNGETSYFFDENGTLWRIDISWVLGC